MGLPGTKCVERDGKTICVDRSTGQTYVEGPGVIRKATNFTKAAVKHVRNGKPKSSLEVIQQRFETCQLCDNFKTLAEESVPKTLRIIEIVGTCTHKSCGCYLHNERRFPNKLAWADQACPEGHWEAVDGEDT